MLTPLPKTAGSSYSARRIHPSQERAEPVPRHGERHIGVAAILSTETNSLGKDSIHVLIVMEN